MTPAETQPTGPREDASSVLLARARAGDGEAFDLLCQPLADQLFRQAFVLCRNTAHAQDLTQETLLAAWQSMQRFHGQCRFSTWLCAILLHRHHSALRRARWWNLFLPISPEHHSLAESMPDPGPAPDQTVQRSERARRMLAALDRLPRRQREVILMRFYAEESLAGMAAALNCSIGTVKSRLFHALENLRRMNHWRKESR